MGSRIRLLTFNTWGLRFISKFRKQRLEAIAEALAHPADDEGDYDIVALQEVWTEEDWQYISNACALRYPYRRQFKLGMIAGPGLALLSKIPIEETFLYRFPINGRSLAIFRGDWYVGKLIAVTLLKPTLALATPIAILNSHMHAPYLREGDALYLCHRACQAWDFAKYVRMLRKAGYAVIQVGDLNSEPGTLPHRLFTTEGGLDDSWDLLQQGNPVTKAELASMLPQEQVERAGVTCDLVLNTWRKDRRLDEACRLDYAFVDSTYITPVRGDVRFTELVPLLQVSYLDHFAYFVELEVRDFSPATATRVRSDSYGAARAARASRALELGTAVAPVAESDFRDLTERVTVYRDLLLEISKYRRFTIPYQLAWRKHHFFSSIAIVAALHLVVVFSLVCMDPVSAGVIMFISCAVGILGVINGLIWGLGVRAELRALQEVQQQVKDKVDAIKNELNELIDMPAVEDDL